MKYVYAGLLALSVAGLPAAKAEWYDDMKLKGDIRYRHEQIDDSAQPDTQSRERIRIRAGVDARVNSEVNAVFQLTTTEGTSLAGGGDPISGNQTLTGGGSKKFMYLDLGYIDYHPEAVKGLSLIGGKMKSPYIAVGDMIWDNDYTPEGLALTYKTGDDVQFLLNAANHWFIENKAGNDPQQYGGQVALNFTLGKAGSLMAGCSYFATANLDGAPVLDYKSSNNTYGNSSDSKISGTTTSKVYKADFANIEPFVQLTLDVGLPLKFYAQYTKNTDADSYDTGYLAGVTLGEAKDPHTYEFGYNYRKLEKDAVLGALADSDSSGGGTDNQGHKLFARYQISKGFQAGVSYFMDEKKISAPKTVDYNRLQVDFIAKF